MTSKSKSQTVGYRYFMSVQAGLGRGPLDELVEIRVGDLVAWHGSVTDNATIGIFKPDLFGGDKKEGGIVGALQIYMGGPTQTVDAPPALDSAQSQPTYQTKLGLPLDPTAPGFFNYFMVAIKTMLTGLVPAFRGVATTWFDGMVASGSPYPKEWKYRQRRLAKGWHNDDCWYPEKVAIPMGGPAEGATATIVPLGLYTEGDVAENVVREGSGAYYHGERIGDAVWSNLNALDSTDPHPEFAGTLNDGAYVATNVDNISDYLYVRDFDLAFPEGVTPAKIMVRVTWNVWNGGIYVPIADIWIGTWYWLDYIGLAWGAGGANMSDSAFEVTGPAVAPLGDWPNADPNNIVVREYEFDVATIGLTIEDITSADFGVKIATHRDGYIGGSYCGVQKLEVYAAYEAIPQAIVAMNPAHIILQCATDPDWGSGVALDKLDLDSFTRAADTLYDEGFGLCLPWFRQETIEAFIQVIIDHIGAVLYVDRGTGLGTLKLIRGDYDPETLPLYTYDSGLLSVDEDDTAAADIAYNEIVVKYHDPITDEDRSVRAQNVASRQASGATASTTTSYPGIPTHDLAARVALRDLQTTASGLKRYKVKLDRRGWRIHPGSVFRISAPERGIGNVVLRAGKVEDGTLKDGAISIIAMQDVFGLPATSYVVQGESGWTPPNNDPQQITSATGALVETSYRDLVGGLSTADLATVTVEQAYVGAVAAKPLNSTAIDFQFWDAAAGEAAYREAGVGDYAPSGVLSATLLPYDTAVTFTGGTGFTAELIGQAILIEDEVCRVDDLDYAAGTMTIARGCADSIPAAHAAGSRFYFYDDHRAFDIRAYAEAEVISGRLLMQTGSGVLPLDAAATLGVTLAARQGRPYPPANVKVGGVPIFALTDTVEGDIVVTWTHRDRLTQADTLVEHEAASIGPEAGVTYTFDIYNLDTGTADPPVRTVTGLTGTTWTYTTADASADGWFHQARIEFYAERDDLTSWKKYSFVVTREVLTFDSSLVRWDSSIHTFDEA